MDYEETELSPKISKINAAGLINLTLNNLWNDFYRHLSSATFSKANADLNCIWIELGGDVKDGDEDDVLYNGIELDLGNSTQLKKSNFGGFSTPTKEDLENFSKQYRILVRKGLFLKRLQNKQGKGTAYLEGDEDYMD